MALPQGTTVCFSKLSSPKAPTGGITRLLREREQSVGLLTLGTSSVVQRVFEALRGDPDLAYLLRDDCLASPESRWGKRGAKGQ